MRVKILFLSSLLSVAALVSCNKTEAVPEVGKNAVIQANIESNNNTRAYIDSDGVTIYWSLGDELGIYTSEGTKNSKFTAETTEDAYNGDFVGTLVDETPLYGYYPYTEQSGDYTAVKLNLSAEQDATSISKYNFMASNTFIQTGTNDYAMDFTAVMTLLAVDIDASGTPFANSSLKSVTVKAGALDGGAAPVMTGDFTMNLAAVTTSFSQGGNDYAKLVWETPHQFVEGKATAYMFVNPEAIDNGTPLEVTFETQEGNLATASFTSAKDCEPNTVYQFGLNLAELGDKVTYDGTPLASLKFTQANNQGKLLKSSLYTGSGLSTGQDYVNSTTSYDIECAYNEATGLWEGVIPYLYDFSGLVASFEVAEAGATVTVNGVSQVSGSTANDFNSIVTYEVVSPSGKRTSAKVKLVNSGLPVVTINGTVYSKTTEFVDIEGTTTINIDGTDYTCGLRLRGNSTQNMPKKPYAIKLDSKAGILGMPAHKRWVLLANWLDRTMLRNDLAFYIARQTGSWAPRGKFVEVVLNGVHVGNYWLGEQIKIDENRLNIADVNAADYTTSDDVAANVGFLLECDVAADETEIYFQVNSPVPFYVYIKDPGDASSYLGSSSSYGATQAYKYIQNYYTSIGSCLQGSDWTTLPTLIDYNSFADHWIYTELIENQESKHPKSFYMYKDAGAKMCAGPAWDYDWGTFIPMDKIGSETSTAGTVKDYWTARYTMWYTYLFNDAAFVAAVKTRWAAFKAGFESALPYLDGQIELLKVSDKFNHEMWPCTGFNYTFPNYDESLSFEDATAQMRAALKARIEWLDSEINSL